MKLKIAALFKGDDLNSDTPYTVSNMSSDENSGNTKKIYQIDEAGEYIEETYKGITVYVRENYPYYNPQSDKIYYSKEEEAEDLYQLSKNMTKSSIHDLDI